MTDKTNTMKLSFEAYWPYSSWRPHLPARKTATEKRKNNKFCAKKPSVYT